jgi:hypothetical protein
MTGVILVDKQEYDMEPGNYRWTKESGAGTQSITTDAASPNQIAKELTAVAIKEGSLITIEVEDDPKMSAYLWNESGRLKNIPLKDNQFSAPSKKGQYIYEVVANWSNNNSVGEISYTFVVEVK